MNMTNGNYKLEGKHYNLHFLKRKILTLQKTVERNKDKTTRNYEKSRNSKHHIINRKNINKSLQLAKSKEFGWKQRSTETNTLATR